MKKILLTLFMFFIFQFSIVNAWNDTSSCDKPNLSIKSKIETCNEAVKPFLSREDWNIIKGSSIRSIEDFVCLQDASESRVFQIVLDTDFTEIDCEMEQYFQSLTNSKNLYFWKDAKFSYFDWINHIWEKSKYFEDLYSSACVKVVDESAEYIENSVYTLDEEKPSVSVSEAREYLKWWWWDCQKLIKLKISIFNNVAFNVLQLNKAQVSKDQKKLYDQEQRTKYSKVLDLMMINLWYIERIRMKWPSKIKNAL